MTCPSSYSWEVEEPLLKILTGINLCLSFLSSIVSEKKFKRWSYIQWVFFCHVDTWLILSTCCRPFEGTKGILFIFLGNSISRPMSVCIVVHTGDFVSSLKQKKKLPFFFFFFFASVCSGLMWDLSSQTRDWTQVTAVKALSPNH